MKNPENYDAIRIDGIIWKIQGSEVIPICPKDNLQMYPVNNSRFGWEDDIYNRSNILKCLDDHFVEMKRGYGDEIRYITDRLKARDLKNIKILNLDDEAMPIAKANSKTTDNKYSATIQVMESKRGLQVVVYAGKKGGKNTQIFVEPEAKKMSFDHNDAHPSEIFTEITAKFQDGTSSTIKKNDKN